VFGAELGQSGREAAAFENADGFLGQILPGLRLEPVDVVDQYRFGGVIA
jgi:hypothetical protein